jgi:hypothetical protein
VKACSDIQKRIADLEAKVRFVEARSINVTADSEKCLREFEGGLVQKLEELCRLYVDNVQIIGSLCSQISTEC